MPAKLPPVIAASLTAGQVDGNFSFNRFRMASGRLPAQKAQIKLTQMATPHPQTGEASVMRHPSRIFNWMPTPRFLDWFAEEFAEDPRADMTEEDRWQEAEKAFAGLEE